MSAEAATDIETAMTTDESNCDHCGDSPAFELPADHRLADEFRCLCAACAGMTQCTEDDCDAAFFGHDERVEHIRTVHGDGWDGDHDCPHCGESVTPSAITSDDPRMGGVETHARKSYVCPACGHGLRGVGRDAGRLA